MATSDPRLVEHAHQVYVVMATSDLRLVEHAHQVYVGMTTSDTDLPLLLSPKPAVTGCSMF